MAEVLLDGVVKRYGDVLAVDHVSLTCADGEFLALLGPSGCGKTSTMRMIAGLEAITEGSVLLDGRRVNDLPPAQRNVAMAFENYGLYPHRTVFGNMAYPLRLRGRDDEGIARAVAEIAVVLGIADVLDRYPRELSVGAMQRVSLARALVRDPSVFLIDEPLSHVDADRRSQMRGEIKRLHHVNGSTTIYVTHDQLEALTMADRVAVMDRGVLQQVGPPDEIYEHPANRFVATFVGEPPMNLLRAALADDGAEATLTVDGVPLLALSGRLRRAVLDAAAGAAGAIDVGVRPDDLEVAAPGRPGLPGTVRVRELIGSSALLSVDAGAHRLRVRTTPAQAPGEGAAVRLHVRPDRLHLFHPVSGVSLVPLGADRVPAAR